MSIALSAVIHPSRLLRAFLAAWAMACGAAALLLVSDDGARFHGALWLAAACLGGTVLAWRSVTATAKVRQIDISGLGQIQLSVKQSLGAAPQQSEPMKLLPGSTIWPSLQILLLQGDSGNVTSVPILHDSVAAGAFRHLAVSITTIARRDNKFSKNNKIL